MVSMTLVKFFVVLAAAFVAGGIIARKGHKLPKGYGYLIIEPDSNNVMIDLGGVNPNRLRSRDVVGLEVRHLEIRRYVEAKEHARYRMKYEDESQKENRA